MRVRNLPLDQIVVPPVRITAVFDEELRTQLGLSLGQAGQLQPIIVVEKDGAYLLVDGLHRIEEARRRGDPTIPAVVHQGDEVTALLYNVASSRLKGKIAIGNLLEVVGYMTQTLQLDSIEIARITGMTRDYVERLWRVSEACEEIQDALQRETVGLAVAAEIARLPHPDQQRYVLGVAERYKMPAKEVKVYVDQALSPLPAPSPETAATAPLIVASFVCEGCGLDPGPGLLRPVLACPSCFGELYARRRGLKLPSP